MGFPEGAGYFIHPPMRGGLVTDIFISSEAGVDRDLDDDWAEWPESELEIDDEAFAAAIARGRRAEAA